MRSKELGSVELIKVQLRTEGQKLSSVELGRLGASCWHVPWIDVAVGQISHALLGTASTQHREMFLTLQRATYSVSVYLVGYKTSEHSPKS